jgi:hypothetical protein
VISFPDFWIAKIAGQSLTASKAPDMCKFEMTPLKTGFGKSAVNGKLFMPGMTYRPPIA